jgi:hypothetical protein
VGVCGLSVRLNREEACRDRGRDRYHRSCTTDFTIPYPLESCHLHPEQTL